QLWSEGKICLLALSNVTQEHIELARPRRSPGYTVRRNFRRPWKTRAFTAPTEVPRIRAVSWRDRSSMSQSRMVLRSFGPKRLIASPKSFVRSRRQQRSEEHTSELQSR